MGPFVLIPGFQDTAAVWIAVLSRLDMLGWPTTPITLREVDADPEIRGRVLESYRDQVLATLDDLEPTEPVVVIGHSMGAQIAELVAIDLNPDQGRRPLAARRTARPDRGGTRRLHSDDFDNRWDESLMKAIEFDRYGEPGDVLRVSERPVPEPGAGEVRVKIRLSPVNPSDLLYVRGHYSGVTEHFPSGAGFEGVCDVDAIGAGVDGLTVGQRVFARNSPGGNWAEYAVVPSNKVYPVPDDIPDEQIASFLINPATAILMVRHVLAVPRGEWLLQSAATSELGRMIIRLAKRDGIRTLNVVRRPDAVAGLKALGADAVVVSSDGPIDDQVHDVVGPEGVSYAIDPVAGQTGTEVFRSLGENGRMLVYGSLTNEPIEVGEDARFTLSGRRTLEVYWLGYWLPRLEDSGFFSKGKPAIAQLIDEITGLIREGVLATNAGTKYPIEDIHRAVTEAESPGRDGKIFIAGR